MSGRGNKAGASDETVIRIPPHYYIHVLDLKTNVTKPIIGPETFVRQVMGHLDILCCATYICHNILHRITLLTQLSFRSQLCGFKLPVPNQTIQCFVVIAKQTFNLTMQLALENHFFFSKVGAENYSDCKALLRPHNPHIKDLRIFHLPTVYVSGQ